MKDVYVCIVFGKKHPNDLYLLYKIDFFWHTCYFSWILASYQHKQGDLEQNHAFLSLYLENFKKKKSRVTNVSVSLLLLQAVEMVETHISSMAARWWMLEGFYPNLQVVNSDVEPKVEAK